jgi:AAA+ superfamily predicted ATPase
MARVPALEAHCGSWVVVSRATGLPVLETYSRATAERINQTAYEVLTAAQWLGRFNRSVAA